MAKDLIPTYIIIWDLMRLSLKSAGVICLWHNQLLLQNITILFIYSCSHSHWHSPGTINNECPYLTYLPTARTNDRTHGGRSYGSNQKAINLCIHTSVQVTVGAFGACELYYCYECL